MDGKLREIIESKKDDREIAEFAGITLTLAEYDFLIEQAEHFGSMLKELEEQNKRYREVIKKAIDDLENECLWDALIALKALEGGE